MRIRVEEKQNRRRRSLMAEKGTGVGLRSTNRADEKKREKRRERMNRFWEEEKT